jgi:hypothetical protein
MDEQPPLARRSGAGVASGPVPRQETSHNPEAILRTQARAIRPWAWVALLGCVLAIVFAVDSLLFGPVNTARDRLLVPRLSAFWSALTLLVLWAVCTVTGIAGLTAFRRWFRDSFGSVWRRALRRVPVVAAVAFGVAAGALTMILGLLWAGSSAFAVFVSLTWALVVGLAMRPPRLQAQAPWLWPSPKNGTTHSLIDAVRSALPGRGGVADPGG